MGTRDYRHLRMFALTVVVVVLTVLLLIVAVIAWRRPRAPRGRKVPMFEGRLGPEEQNLEFIEFLSLNEGRHVHIAVTLPWW